MSRCDDAIANRTTTIAKAAGRKYVLAIPMPNTRNASMAIVAMVGIRSCLGHNAGMSAINVGRNRNAIAAGRPIENRNGRKGANLVTGIGVTISQQAAAAAYAAGINHK